MEETTYLLNVLVAAIAGASSGYFAPWFAWKLEVRRETRSHKRGLIAEWRNELLDPDKHRSFATNSGAGNLMVGGRVALTGQRVASNLHSMRSFASIKPHLSQVFLAKIDRYLSPEGLEIETGGPIYGRLPWLLDALRDEIARIERDWRLI